MRWIKREPDIVVLDADWTDLVAPIAAVVCAAGLASHVVLEASPVAVTVSFLGPWSLTDLAPILVSRRDPSLVLSHRLSCDVHHGL